MSATNERYVIGAMLINNELIEQVSGIVNPEDFSDSICRDMMYLIMAVRGKGQEVDVVSVSNVRPSLSCGLATIAEAADILQNTPGWSNWLVFANSVREASLRRAYSATLQNLLSVQTGTAAEMIAEAQSQLSRIADGSKTPEVRRVSECMPELIQSMQERMDANGAVDGLLSGYKDLDGLLCGMRGGHMVVVAGRPGTGKTTLAMNIAENIGGLGIPSLIFSLEMSSKELTRRMLSSVGKVPLSVIDTGKIENHGAQITAGAGKIKELPVYVCDRGGMNINQIRSIAKFQKRANKIEMVVIDYIGLIRASGSKTSNRTQELGEISRQCKEMAKELNIPVIVLAQLNREIDKTERDPRLSDLRDSGEIEQDADVVAFVCKTQDDGISKIVVAKHRHAKPGDCRMVHRGDLSRFDSMQAGYVEPAKKSGLDAY